MRTPTYTVSPEEIAWAFGRAQDVLGATEDEIKNSNFRERHIVDAREALALWFRQRGLSYGQIGCVLAKDHSSALHMVRRAVAKRDACAAERRSPATRRLV